MTISTFLVPQDDFGPPDEVGLYDILRREIVSLVLPPGSVLSINALAERHGITVQAVRQATALLSAEGFLRHMPGTGMLVRRIQIASLAEGHFMRLAAELEVVRRLANYADIETLARAQTILTMQDASPLEDAEGFSGLDAAFHRTLFGGVGMERLHRRLESREGDLARLRWLDGVTAGRRPEILDAHRRILEAIEMGEPDTACRQMRLHLGDALSRIDMLRNAYPDYFSGP